jgi:hypothetical protein
LQITILPTLTSCQIDPLADQAACAREAELFGETRHEFEDMVGWLGGPQASQLAHEELEAQMQVRGRELLRKALQSHLELRAYREPRREGVADAQGVVRTRVEANRCRGLRTVFGEVQVSRLAYRRDGHRDLHPADVELNLPSGLHSHGLRQLAAVEASRGSFEQVQEAVERSTGERLGKRQLEELTQRAAVDFGAFYAQRQPTSAEGQEKDTLVLSCDGKGIVMRPKALRTTTAQAAERAVPKRQTRLSPGEKRNRKRMAEVGAVYDATPAPRTPVDVLATSKPSQGQPPPAPGPIAKNKWLVASVTDDAAQVVKKVFEEAERRDPEHYRTWLALVDGNNHQIDRIETEAKERGVNVTIVVDFIHVIEYLWKAARCFHKDDDPNSESWVLDQALEVLDGHALAVAESIRHKACSEDIDPASCELATQAAGYLTNKAPYLDYPMALQCGWPIATGVIEGACRHLVKDRMDLTGARWGLDGAEAVLKLRAISSNSDFSEYWRFHLAQERLRTHLSRFSRPALPLAA